jgi:membrane protein YdbS with pleckstrin-like domain
LWTFRVLIRTIVIVGGLTLTYALVESSRPWVGPILAILTVILGVTMAVMPTWRYLIHRWEHTDRAVYLLKGWLVREWRVIPISRIQTIDTMKSPLQQVLRLATLRVTTASTHGAISIEGLDADVAADTARVLTEITQATKGDAT